MIVVSYLSVPTFCNVNYVKYAIKVNNHCVVPPLCVLNWMVHKYVHCMTTDYIGNETL